MRMQYPRLTLELDVPDQVEHIDTTWLIKDIMEGGPWVLGGKCSAQDRSKLLFDFARAAAAGAPLLGSNGPTRQMVRYVNFAKSEAAALADLKKAGLVPGHDLNVFDPRHTGPNTFNIISRKIMPAGGLILVDGITASRFGGAADVMEFLEIALAGSASNLNIIVSLPDGLAGSRSLRQRSDRFLRYANLMWVESTKGQLTLQVRAHEASDSSFFDVGSEWLPTTARNPMNPTEAAIAEFLYNQRKSASNREIQKAVEPSGASIEADGDKEKVSGGFHKVLQRLCKEGGIKRDQNGFYYSPMVRPSEEEEKEDLDNATAGSAGENSGEADNNLDHGPPGVSSIADLAEAVESSADRSLQTST